MIYVDRSRVPVPALYESAEYGEMQRTIEEQLGAYGKTKRQSRLKFNFSSLRRLVTEDLFALFESKCAYCEQPLKQTKFAVDHFRPTSLYPWLAYEWNNLYLSCVTCHTNKGSVFPLVDESKRAVGQKSGFRRESPILLDPCEDDPERYLAFLPDGSVEADQQHAEIAAHNIEVFGLNRPRLKRLRKKECSILKRKLQPVSYNLMKEKALVSEELSSAMPFAAMRRELTFQWAESETGPFAKRGPDMRKRVRTALKSVDVDFEEVTRRIADAKSVPPTTSRPEQVAVQVHELPLNTASIAKITIKNFKAIHSLTIEPIQSTEPSDLLEDSDDESSLELLKGWTTFLGENGSGKSSILQAIALALAGEQITTDSALSPERYLMRGQRSGYVKLQLTRGEPIHLHITKTRFRFKSGGQPHGMFVRAFGSTRLLPNESTSDEMRRVTQRVEYRNMFDPFIPLIDANSWLSSLSDKNKNDEFRKVRLAIKDLLGLDEERTVEKSGDEILVDGQPLDNLSAGYQTIIAVACDIMAGVPQDLDDMQHAQGVVLIDEIGSHLHPSWKMRIVSRLRKAFPLIQFITSTHEPLCLRGLDDGEVFVVKRYVPSESEDEEKRVVLESDLPSPRGLRVDQLLTSEHFGLGTTIDPGIERLFSEYYQLLSLKDDISAPQKRRRNALKHQLRKRGVLGYTRRDQLVYEAIDEYLAEVRSHPTTANSRTAARRKKEREKREAEVKQRVVELWGFARTIREELNS